MDFFLGYHFVNECSRYAQNHPYTSKQQEHACTKAVTQKGDCEGDNQRRDDTEVDFLGTS
ncbi:Unknown protein sequence [Pseudomonas amygdali pv. lachrymans]|uniref:Uncharacterized protein n=1 Tax=Pseudomonas amygdali pv. lachrymans TaxID=53707 RepID=A0ABR5KUE1_PSEAV|nr:Unknown protein sequence [Pseudomonas amygdali pv. lachrymans]KPC18180.1 Unknown protein sequence [Pseudomonas amygdali pv. lachrymans]RMT06476.1 hypothetical protein ALP54_102886 [Pseudomonas amygdali pv. lachrymans]